jgi:hypothetical protein
MKHRCVAARRVQCSGPVELAGVACLGKIQAGHGSVSAGASAGGVLTTVPRGG